MSLHLEDTIVALSSAAGSGGRAVVRLTGPRSLEIARATFQGDVSSGRGITEGSLNFRGIGATLPADLYHFPAPNSATGQAVVELHFLSSPPLVDLLLADLLRAGARAAQPGEFSLRGFLAGKLDLSRAEAILGVIEAGDRDELRLSLRQLAGGVSKPLAGLRDDLLNLLADLEAGLDFVEEDIQFVERPDLLARIARGLAQVSIVQKQVQDRGLANRPFRVALTGAPNAGKSQLFNALSGEQALVSAMPGTTRDYLVARLDLDGVTIELIDTAGLRITSDELESRAQQLGQVAIDDADLVLHCVEPDEKPISLVAPGRMIIVATKSDLAPVYNANIATSAITGDGLDELRRLLTEHATRFTGRGLAPSLTRCRHHVETCLTHLRAAHQSVLFSDPPEIVALELRSALEHLGAMTGAVHTDDLLDRVFSRFCIGK